MTVKEVIDDLKYFYEFDDIPKKESAKIAIEALEKQEHSAKEEGEQQ